LLHLEGLSPLFDEVGAIELFKLSRIVLHQSFFFRISHSFDSGASFGAFSPFLQPISESFGLISHLGGLLLFTAEKVIVVAVLVVDLLVKLAGDGAFLELNVAETGFLLFLLVCLKLFEGFLVGCAFCCNQL
jgi:hypothetical protein